MCGEVLLGSGTMSSSWLAAASVSVLQPLCECTAAGSGETTTAWACCWAVFCLGVEGERFTHLPAREAVQLEQRTPLLAHLQLLQRPDWPLHRQHCGAMAETKPTFNC